MLRRRPRARFASTPDRRRRGRAVAGLLILAAALAWLAGLLGFAGRLPERPADPLAATDAIVVLTGGSKRLSEGLDLLAQGRARKLLVTGVARGVELDQILLMQRDPERDISCCVALGYGAADTVGNAAETAEWMVREGFRSLRLVTASYHMQRSLLEFSAAMPGLEIVPHPVFPDDFHGEAWWRWPGTLNLVLSEYNKTLLAGLRIGIARLVGHAGGNAASVEAGIGQGDRDRTGSPDRVDPLSTRTL